MGLLDQILGSAMGQPGAGGQSNLMQLALQLVSDHPGGLQGLIQSFTQAGLGQQMQSWVSTGQNLPITADQIMKVLGSGQLHSLAQQFGIDPQAAAGGLAGLLPQVVDHLTPTGAVQDDAIAQGLNLLKGKLLS